VRAGEGLQSRCSDDLPCWRRLGGVHNRVPICICIAPNAGRTAKTTSTGASWRAGDWPTAAWSSGTCCTSVRSTTIRRERGPGRSRPGQPGSTRFKDRMAGQLSLGRLPRSIGRAVNRGRWEGKK
jgi:hypothetical protein